MQISFLSFSIFAGFWSLDDKEVITLFGHYIFFHYSIRNGAVNACFFHCSIWNGAVNVVSFFAPYGMVQKLLART